MTEQPRLGPVDPGHCDEAVQRLLRHVPAGPDGRPLNVFGTLAHAGPLFAAGLTQAEVDRVPTGAAAGWDDLDRLVLAAVDELHTSASISTPTWSELAEHLDPAQLVELCLVVGQYHLVAFVLNSAGVQLEPGLTGLPRD